MVKIIAEMSGNHNGSLERALAIVEAAAEAGCWALKIQSYTPDSITLNSSNKDFIIDDPSSPWNGYKLYDLYKVAATPYEWHEAIFKKCQELKLTCFSSPFDCNTVDFLETLNCPIYKIASYENADFLLLKKVAQTKKPVIISIGLLSLDEIYESVEVLTQYGCTDLTLLKCTSTYPASAEDSNIKTITDLKARFPHCKIGLSDHTIGIGTAIASIALGAEVIEKHLTISREDGGVDSSFSLNKEEMKMLVTEANNAYKALGEVKYDLTEAEKKSLKFKRSLYTCCEIKQGEIITEHKIRSVRPNFGLPVKFYDQLIGKKAKMDLPYGCPLKFEDLE